MPCEDVTNINTSLIKTYFTTRCFIRKPWWCERVKPFTRKQKPSSKNSNTNLKPYPSKQVTDDGKIPIAAVMEGVSVGDSNKKGTSPLCVYISLNFPTSGMGQSSWVLSHNTGVQRPLQIKSLGRGLAHRTQLGGSVKCSATRNGIRSHLEATSWGFSKIPRNETGNSS